MKPKTYRQEKKVPVGKRVSELMRPVYSLQGQFCTDEPHQLTTPPPLPVHINWETGNLTTAARAVLSTEWEGCCIM